MLEMRIGQTRYVEHLAVNVVWAREVGTVPDGQSPLDWMLLTNQAVDDFDAARLVVFSYTQRWRRIADLGGYTGKSSGGPPGTITIGRGLQRICDAAELLEQMERERTPR